MLGRSVLEPWRSLARGGGKLDHDDEVTASTAERGSLIRSAPRVYEKCGALNFSGRNS